MPKTLLDNFRSTKRNRTPKVVKDPDCTPYRARPQAHNPVFFYPVRQDGRVEKCRGVSEWRVRVEREPSIPGVLYATFSTLDAALAYAAGVSAAAPRRKPTSGRAKIAKKPRRKAKRRASKASKASKASNASNASKPASKASCVAEPVGAVECVENLADVQRALEATTETDELGSLLEEFGVSFANDELSIASDSSDSCASTLACTEQLAGWDGSRPQTSTLTFRRLENSPPKVLKCALRRVMKIGTPAFNFKFRSIRVPKQPFPTTPCRKKVIDRPETPVTLST